MDWLSIVTVILGIALGLAIAAFLMRKTLGPWLSKQFAKAYQQRFTNNLKKKYPLISERIAEFEMTPESQTGFQTALNRLPPQEAQKLQTEFNRLRENFMIRHPELKTLLDSGSGSDPKGQMKAMDAVMKLPADQRATIEKDLIWAWDQLRGRFPRLMGPLEAAFKRRAEAPKP